MNRRDAEDAEKAVKACFCDQHAARNPDRPTIQLKISHRKYSARSASLWFK